MLTKLSLRNAKRSIRDYLIYLITMSGVAALMFAFDSVVFSKDIAQMCENASVMGAMIGLATVFIIIIVSWLINYRVRFMLEKRSKEFGTYLILGMNQKEIAQLYMRENLIMGGIAFVIGSVVGFFLEQGLLVLLYQLFSKEYQIRSEFSFIGLIVTFVCFFVCYLRTLLRSRKMFRNMTISDLMRMDKENEQIEGGRDKALQLLFPLGLILLGGAYFIICKLPLSFEVVAAFIVAFTVGIYFFYIGLSSALFCYLSKKGKGTYKKHNIFIMRQLASKLRTMRFTMGTISLLLCIALIGGTIAMMFAKYQDTAVNNVLPFDVIIFNQEDDYQFEEERSIVSQDSPIQKDLVYNIYHTERKNMIHYLAMYNDAFAGDFINEDGSFNQSRFEEKNWSYYEYDTYMLESDYNELRSILGLTPVSLGKQEYTIQVKPRVAKCLGEDIKSETIDMGGVKLKLSEIYTDDFSQNGHNGADFVIVVPDTVKDQLTPYYSLYVAKLTEEPSDKLQGKLADYERSKIGKKSEDEYEYEGISMDAIGSDQIISMASDVMVRTGMRQETMFAVASIILPTVYIALVFVCIALTILAVQQLSESGKFRFRYDVLRKLGLSERQIEGVVGKQLLIYYLIPALFAVLLSSGISILAGNKFVLYTGAKGSGIYYYGLSLVIFMGVYLLYFIATYVGFIRNVRK